MRLRTIERGHIAGSSVARRELSFHSLFHRGHHRISLRVGAHYRPSSQRKQGFFQILPESYRGGDFFRASDGSRAPQEPHGQQKQGAQQSKNAVNCDTHNTKRKQQKPNKGVDYQRQQRERPAQNEQDDPKKECSHGNLTRDRAKPSLLFATPRRSAHTPYYERMCREVPFTAKSLRRRRLAMDSGTSASSRMWESSTSECRTRPNA